MGSSFTRFSGHGFWARDAGIEVWLYLLAREAGEVVDPPDWLPAARQHWHEQATLGFMGCIGAGLDEILATPERAALVATLGERALDWLRAQAPLPFPSTS